MKKIIRSAYVALVGMLAFTAASCTDDYTYDQPQPVTGAQVYFSSEEPSTIEVSETASSFNVPIHRINTKGEATVGLTFTAEDGNIYNVPSTVSFADGEADANITVTYDPAKLVYGDYVGGTIRVADSTITTPYGVSYYTFKAGVTAYKTMSGGKGIFRDDLVGPLYGQEVTEWNVEIQENVKTPGLYRVVKPYASGTWRNYFTGTSDANGNDLIIDATDPDHVYFANFDAGVTLNSQDGNLSYITYVQYYLMNGKKLDEVKASHPELFGKLEDGIISFSTPKSCLAAINGEGWYYANTNGALKIALPGHQIKDYTAKATFEGRFTDTEENDFAKFNVTFGADVASATYYLANSSEDLDAIVQAIIAGTQENTADLNAAGEIQVPYTESGNYTLVIVTYDASGNAQGAYTIPVKLKSSKENVETFEDIALGNLTLGNADLGSYFFEESPGLLLQEKQTIEATLSQSNSDPTHYRLTPYMVDGYPLDFHVDESGTITIDQIETGYHNSSNAAILVSDLVTNMPQYADQFKSMGLVSTYDASKKLYTFNVAYHLAAGGYFAIQQETFQVTEDGSAKAFAPRKAMAKPGAKVAKSAKKLNKQTKREKANL